MTQTDARTRAQLAAAWALLAAACAGAAAAAPSRETPARDGVGGQGADSPVRLAITDLVETFGPRYPRGREYLARLDALTDALHGGDRSAAAKLKQLRAEALLANPLLDPAVMPGLLVLKRRRGQLGLPVNHMCNTGIRQTGYDNELAVLSPVRPDGEMRTLFRPAGGRFVGEMDLHFDADRLLFTMPDGRTWQIFELAFDGGRAGRPRQVSRGDHPDVDNFDACYLPDGGIVFASTASFHAVPCWHGRQRACAIYRMGADGGSVRQLCFDQDLDLHPSVLPNGQVVFSRWDYAGTMHMYLRPLMVMNPDGTAQRAAYGSNSYWPNALYFPRGIPHQPGKVVAIVAGYHGVPRMGELAVLDLNKGWHEADGVVQRLPGRGKPVVPVIRDRLVDGSWPKFLHPYPLSDASSSLGAGKYFLAACQPTARSPWGVYLVDVFDNVVPVQVQEGFDLFEPIPLQRRPRPPVISDRVDLNRDDAVVYLHDVYAGEGLKGVPRGTVRRLRVAAYHYGYPLLAGPDKVGSGGPWEVMRIIGTVPVEADGSAVFRVPAGTPLTVQPLDAEGKAVQLMRSWFTAMPGETLACVGCHEPPSEAPAATYAAAGASEPRNIEPWYGPARGLDFARDVQPVLDKYCVACHCSPAGTRKGRRMPDLRSADHLKDYAGRPLTKLAAGRLDAAVRQAWGGTNIRYTPAYEALLPYIRRVNVEDEVALLAPGEYHADTSEVVQVLRKRHHGVELDREAWDRLVTWIDLNGPCHGTWGEVAPVPGGADRRRRELALLTHGPKDDPEAVPKLRSRRADMVIPEEKRPDSCDVPDVPGWPFSAEEAGRRQRAAGAAVRTVDLGGGVAMQLVRVPAGAFVMGCWDTQPDEAPPAQVAIAEEFWMGSREVTNEQFRRFDAAHDSGRFAKRFNDVNGPGLSLAGAKQPAVRVSWRRAMDFCRWLSAKAGNARLTFTLPTEAEWEYACRAGATTDLSFGDVGADFSAWANLADRRLARRPTPTGGLDSNIMVAGDIVCDDRFDDGAVATADVGRYRPNSWGLYDMHGNAAEWTLTTCRPYPYVAGDGRNDASGEGRKVVRGGSWVDRPSRCRSTFRLDYPSWRRVHNVGFRVVCRASTAAPSRER